MHNRVRMITASFLTKDLHVWWPVGARHFLDHLVDGDIASNNHGWQWVAGTGTDASPYFRVFNPVTQGQKFDPDGDYVRRWVPELRPPAGRRGPRAVEARQRVRPRAIPEPRRRPRRGAQGDPGPLRARPTLTAPSDQTRGASTCEDPVAELRAFLDAALLEPVRARARRPARRRCRGVASSSPITLVVGSVVLAWALRDPAGRPALLRRHARPRGGLGRRRARVRAAPLRPRPHPLGRARGPAHRAVPRARRPAARSSSSSAPLVVAHIPVLREPVDQLLDHARFGSLPVVLAITMVNGIVEELYFRGALYAALPSPRGRHHDRALRPDDRRQRHPAARARGRHHRARHRAAAPRHRRHPRPDHHARDVVDRDAPAPPTRPRADQVIRMTSRHRPHRALVTGASGYVGGQVVPRLLDEGWTVRVLTRRRASMDGKPWVDRVEVAEGDVGLGRRHAPGARGRRRRVVPRALDGRPARLPGARPRGRDALLRGGQGGRRLAHRLPRRPAPGRRGALAAPGLARRGRPHPARLGRADRGAPGRRRARRRVGVLRHAAPPHDAAARDGRPEVARQQDPADRRSTTSSRCSSAPAACRPRSTAPSTSAAPRC